ncbi:MAG: alpha-L-fucosidase [Actinomycetota bacterium]
MSLTRRQFLVNSAIGLGASLALPQITNAAANFSDVKKFEPTWESLTGGYQTPEWFRDAKFGIWAHWSAQCQPEQGDWYARGMYQQGSAQNKFHLKNYGHPSKFGFMEIDNLWKAERWEPEKLMNLYKNAGAKYFVALANHHDNFDNYDSKYHQWNSVKVGPKKDLIGIWSKTARANGLRFGVSNHSAHSWHWFQTAYGYDAEGDLAGVRYDAATLTKADGKGKWWEGLDPQELYTGANLKIPDGIRGFKAVNEWHDKNDRVWNENPPPMNPEFTRTWFLRCQDLIDKYRPDLVYFDNTGLPLGQTGLDIAAHFYNASLKWNKGKLEAVINAKGMKPELRAALVEDIERGQSDKLRPQPWQTDTCIGSWHYNRDIFDKNRYKTVKQVVQTLVDIVSKNGNLLLSIPVRGNGTIDEREVEFLSGMTDWIKINGEAIYGTRPWKIFGEGPTEVKTGMFSEKDAKPFTAQDIRFTTKGEMLYALMMGIPDAETITIKSLAANSTGKIERVELLGTGNALVFTQAENGLTVTVPKQLPGNYVYSFKINGRGLTAS